MTDQLYDMIAQLSSDIKKAEPMIEKSIFIARVDNDGRILLPVQGQPNEFVGAGVSDRDGNYMYIRHRDSGDIIFEKGDNNKIFSCNHRKLNATYSLRLVACVKKADPYVLEENLRTAMMRSKPQCLDGSIKNVEFTPVKSTIDSIAVVRDEAQKAKQFDKNLVFVGIDFNLTFELNYF